MTARLTRPPALQRNLLKKFFIIFVDAIFTTLLERLFTNAREMIAAKSPGYCVCRARHAD
jgi:hypothetical protein